MISYINDNNNSQYDIYIINENLIQYNLYYDDYFNVYDTPQASMLIKNAQDTMHFTLICKSSKLILSLFTYKFLSNDEIKIMTKKAVNDTFCWFNLSYLNTLSYKLKHIKHISTSEPFTKSSHQSSTFMMTLIQIILTTTSILSIQASIMITSTLFHTCMNITKHIIEFSTKHIIEFFTKHVIKFFTVVQNIRTTPSTLIHIYMVLMSLIQAKSTSNSASTTHHTPYTHMICFIFNSEEYICHNVIHHTLQINVLNIDCTNPQIIMATQLHPSYKMSLSTSSEPTMLLKSSLMKSTKHTITIHQTMHTNLSQNTLTVIFILTCMASLLGICNRKNTVIKNLHSNYYEFLWRA